MAVDATYPLLPGLSLLSSALLFCLLATSFVRHSWNLGVTFLCFWLFWENLLSAVNAIVWSDNAAIKLYVYCDISTHIYMLTFIVRPACTLILTRRLYKIASLRSIMPESCRARVIDAVIEWSLGLGLPLLVTGAFYYIVQGHRFEVFERGGCDYTVNNDGVEILLIESPGIILPLISLLFYCREPKLYTSFINIAVTQTSFSKQMDQCQEVDTRILVVGCLDIFLTPPLGVMQLISDIRGPFEPSAGFQWYCGWKHTHTDWDPISDSWNDVMQGETWTVFNFYLDQWTPVILALAIFALFGVTAESRATYGRAIHAIFKLFSWTPSARWLDEMSELQFEIRSPATSGQQELFNPMSRGNLDGDCRAQSQIAQGSSVLTVSARREAIADAERSLQYVPNIVVSSGGVSG